MKISTKSLANLGLVAGKFKELGIGEVIDTCLPKTGDLIFRTLQLFWPCAWMD